MSAGAPTAHLITRARAARRATVLALGLVGALGLAACGSSSPEPASPAAAEPVATTVPPPAMPVTISSPAPGGRVEARLVDGRLEAHVRVRGTARAGSAVRVSTRCGTRVCARRVTPPLGGRWEARVRLLAPVTARSWRISARYADRTAPGRGARVRIRISSPELRAIRAQSQRSSADRSPGTNGAASTSSVSSGSGGEVLVVGDSLEVLTSPYLQRHLPGVKLTINAKGGYSSLQIFELFRESYSPSQSVVVFDAGTNDNPHYPQILAGRLQAVSQIVGDRCLVVPTIHGLTVDGVSSRGKNRVVRAFAAARPGTQVPNWAAAVREHPELMQADDLHPIAAGADYRAQLIAAAVRACMLG